MQEKKVIGKEGGVIVVERTSVKVTIPENAIEGEEQEIEIKVHIGPPNDWQQLESEGYSIDLAQVQMSPSGTKFKKPVEVVTQISSFEDEEDIEWQFADNDLKSRTIWQKATRASSKEGARQLAVSQKPHVSFCIENRKMYAYYMHFTLGRILFKRVTSKCLECSVYCDMRSFNNGSIKLVVVFYEGTKEGKTVCEKLFFRL